MHLLLAHSLLSQVHKFAHDNEGAFWLLSDHDQKLTEIWK